MTVAKLVVLYTGCLYFRRSDLSLDNKHFVQKAFCMFFKTKVQKTRLKLVFSLHHFHETHRYLKELRGNFCTKFYPDRSRNVESSVADLSTSVTKQSLSKL
jgi:hypothetical protein